MHVLCNAQSLQQAPVRAPSRTTMADHASWCLAYVTPASDTVPRHHFISIFPAPHFAVLFNTRLHTHLYILRTYMHTYTHIHACGKAGTRTCIQANRQTHGHAFVYAHTVSYLHCDLRVCAHMCKHWQGGRIVEQGTFHELTSKPDSVFSDLVRRQLSVHKDEE